MILIWNNSAELSLYFLLKYSALAVCNEIFFVNKEYFCIQNPLSPLSSKKIVELTKSWTWYTYEVEVTLVPSH